MPLASLLAVVVCTLLHRSESPFAALHRPKTEHDSFCVAVPFPPGYLQCDGRALQPARTSFQQGTAMHALLCLWQAW